MQVFSGISFTANHSYFISSSVFGSFISPEYSSAIKPNVAYCAYLFTSFCTQITFILLTSKLHSCFVFLIPASSIVSPNFTFPLGSVQVPSNLMSESAFFASPFLSNINILFSLFFIIIPTPIPIFSINFSFALYKYFILQILNTV